MSVSAAVVETVASSNAAKARSVLLLGATGLVGRECLCLLLDDETCSRVVVLTRRPVDAARASPKLEQHVVKFDHLTASARLFDVDQIICALGTTLRESPSPEQYRTIDFLYPVSAAHLGLENGASHYLLVSPLSASSRSRFFYNRLKGELEDALRKLSYRCLTIVRPSVLIGERAEPRLSERIAWKLSFMTPARYKPVRSASVARVLVDAARRDEPGVRVIENGKIEALAVSSR